MAGDSKSHRRRINDQRLDSLQQIAIDNVIITAHNKGDIGIDRLIQSQTELGRASTTSIKKDADRGNLAALKVGGNSLLGRCTDLKHAYLLLRFLFWVVL